MTLSPYPIRIRVIIILNHNEVCQHWIWFNYCNLFLSWHFNCVICVDGSKVTFLAILSHCVLTTAKKSFAYNYTGPPTFCNLFTEKKCRNDYANACLVQMLWVRTRSERDVFRIVPEVFSFRITFLIILYLLYFFSYEN